MQTLIWCWFAPAPVRSKAVIILLLDHYMLGFRFWSAFVIYILFCVHYGLEFVSLRKRKLVALLYLYSWFHLYQYLYVFQCHFLMVLSVVL